MPSFLGQKRPVITMMLKSATRDDLLREIARGREENPDAFGISVGGLAPEVKTYAFLKTLFAEADGRPFYFTNYRRGNINPDVTDDALAEGLLTGLSAGAKLIDVMGDLFSPAAGELTYDPRAVERQKDFIRGIHDGGGEVLMSSHILRYMPKETVFSYATEHRARGADIAKIVTEANSPRESDEALAASVLLKGAGLPCLFLVNGTHCRLHRRVSTYLGNCMYLVTEDEAPRQNQPRISEVRATYNDIFGIAEETGK